jgi:hypothetical protein
VEFKKHINAAGAMRLATLNESVTHVLVTENKLPKSDLETLRRLGIR